MRVCGERVRAKRRWFVRVRGADMRGEQVKQRVWKLATFRGANVPCYDSSRFDALRFPPLRFPPSRLVVYTGGAGKT